MSIEVAICPLCRAAFSQPFDQREFRGIPVSNRICSTCGLVFQSPRMSDEKLAQFYAEEYRKLYQGVAGPDPKDLAVQSARADVLLVFAQQHIPAIQRHLDIGCSAGLLLERFQAKYGCEPVGVEPGDAYRLYAQEHGLKVFPSLEELLTEENAHFDLISLAHVLEHLPDPVSYLSQLRTELLSPDGWLLVEVPNLYAHDCFEIAHLVSFSPHTLLQTLQHAGFEAHTLQEEGLPRSRLIPLYIQLLARPSKQADPSPIQPERWVSQKRRWGLFHRRLLTRLMPKAAWISPLTGQ